MHAGQPERAAAASRAWNNELTAMQVAWKKNPTRALRFSDYYSAMRTLYGRSTTGHDDSSYVVSRMGREHNLTWLRAFQPYNEHPEATIPLSPNGIRTLTQSHSWYCVPLAQSCTRRERSQAFPVYVPAHTVLAEMCRNLPSRCTLGLQELIPRLMKTSSSLWTSKTARLRRSRRTSVFGSGHHY